MINAHGVRVLRDIGQQYLATVEERLGPHVAAIVTRAFANSEGELISVLVSEVGARAGQPFAPPTPYELDESPEGRTWRDEPVQLAPVEGVEDGSEAFKRPPPPVSALVQFIWEWVNCAPDEETTRGQPRRHYLAEMAFGLHPNGKGSSYAVLFERAGGVTRAFETVLENGLTPEQAASWVMPGVPEPTPKLLAKALLATANALGLPIPEKLKE